MKGEEVWRFETARFRVVARVEPEDMDPADSFEFEEDIAAVRNGSVEWFQVLVTVETHDGRVLGRDSLGGCAYANVREFFTSHRDRDPMNRNSSIMRAKQGQNVSICHYFPGMVSEAVADARKMLGDLGDVAA